ncbi:MAG TPA: PAS domain-containing protein [Thermoanaerobaculia bacterium]|nr:PAS domain-containing protein [Thermoanaerobaculia bacterium]
MIDHSPARSLARLAAADRQPDFRALFEGAPDPYLVLAPDLTIVAVSDAYLRATMTRRPEILGRGIFEAFPDNPDDPGATGVSNLRASLERVVAQGVPDAMAVQKYDVRRPGADGGEFEVRHWSPVNTPVFSDTGELVSIIHRVEDVTDFIRLSEAGREQERETAELRQQAQQMEGEIYRRAQQLQRVNAELRAANEELGRQNEQLRELGSELAVARELRRSQELVQAIVDGAAAEVYVQDGDGRFLLVNRRFEARLGRPREAVIGRRDEELYPAEASARRRARHREVLAAVAPRKFEEEVGVGPRRQTYLVVEFPLLDLAGQPYAVCGIATDVSAGKRLEAQLRQSQKMEAIGQLAGGVAHDFNNLITAILGYSRLAADRLGGQPELGSYVGQVVRAGERAAALTQQLLAFSRNQALRPQVVEMNAVVAAVETLLRRLIGEDIELVTALDPDCGRTLADPGQLEQAIVNLAVNGRDAMAGGGTLSLATANVELDAFYSSRHADARPGPHVVLAVSDTGHGMDAETRSHIFEPFFTTKEVGRGTGLGLATVYGIVRQGGGHVEVYSEPGQGAVFKLYFPRVGVEEASAAADGEAPAMLPRGAETVLLVEDDELLRDFLRLLLEQAGYTVFCETSAASALERAPGAAAIDLVLTDVVMPGMSGPELAARLAAILPAARVLYMSGYTADVIARRSLLPPGAPFLEKPFSEDQLLRTVRQVLTAPRA